jgi:hypothetical protein
MKKVKSLNHLKQLSLERRAVVCPKLSCWNKPHPAAFVINLSGFVLCNLLFSGMFVYEPRKAKNGSY